MKTLREMMDLIESAQGVAEGSQQYHVVSKLDGNVLASYKTQDEARKNAHGNPVVSGSLETIGDRQYVREQGVAEGQEHISSLIQQYEDMVELVYDLPPGRKKNIAIDRRDALEAQIEAMPGGEEALRKWAKSYNDAVDEGVAEEQVEESTPDALAKIDNLFRK